MQFKSSVSKEDYLKSVNQKEAINNESPEKPLQSYKEALEKAYEQNDVNKIIEGEYREVAGVKKEEEPYQETQTPRTDKIYVFFDKAMDLKNKVKQELPTKYGKVSIYADDLITKHYDGKRNAIRTFVLAVGSAGIFLIFSPLWLKLISGISAGLNTYWLFKNYEVVEKDNTADMLNYIQSVDSDKVKRR